VNVCWHDATVKRVADSYLVISESTLEELQAAHPILPLTELLEIALEFGKGLALETKHPVPTHGAIERELLKILKPYRARIREAGITVSIMSFSWFVIARLRHSHWNTVYLIPYRWLALFNPGRSISPSVNAIKDVHRFPFGHRKVFVWTANTEEQILLCKKK